MRAFQIHALRDAAKLDVGVVAQVFEGNFPAAVAHREVDFAEPAPADAALNGVTIQRPVAMFECVGHDVFVQSTDC